MTDPTPIRRICPYLGIVGDPASHFREPENTHFCYSPKEAGPVELEEQQRYCFSTDFGACSRFTLFSDHTPVVPPIQAATPERRWQVVLLGVLGVLPIIVLLSMLVFFPPRSDQTMSAQVNNTLTPSRVRRFTSTPIPTPKGTANGVRAPVPTLEPLIIPTPPAHGLLLTFPADASRTGWIASNDRLPHWDERSLLVGSQRHQDYLALIQFDVSPLPPGSEILFAIVEFIGRDDTRLAPSGEWILELLDSASFENGEQVSFEQAAKVPALVPIHEPLTSAQLGTGLPNRFELSAAARHAVERQLENSRLVFRLRGPSGSENLFAWVAGSGTPTLYVVAVLPTLTVVTSTPTPANVMTAAAMAVRATESATRFGTPTRALRLATATPAVGRVIVTPIPTPANRATAQFRSAYATAVAMTTGTFTPTPSNFVTTTPVPLLIPLEQLTPVPTPTPTISPPNRVELARQPIPAELYNKILFLEGSRSNPRIWAMDPDGKNVALLTNREIYDIAQAREIISPDGRYFILQDNQLALLDLTLNIPPRQITYHYKARLVYGPAWSPDGKKIAYVTDEAGPQDIWVYTLQPQSWDRLTVANEKDNFWNQFPSWSPDGKQIVFSSDRGHAGTFSEIWVMNANGSNLRRLGNGIWDTYGPIWIKWHR